MHWFTNFLHNFRYMRAKKIKKLLAGDTNTSMKKQLKKTQETSKRIKF